MNCKSNLSLPFLKTVYFPKHIKYLDPDIFFFKFNGTSNQVKDEFQLPGQQKCCLKACLVKY